MKSKIFLTLATIVVISSCGSSNKKGPNSEADDYVAINELLENYKKSVNEADTTLAKTIWLTNSEVSFIHPGGHEKGWEGIKKGIYEMFGSRFSKRDLKSYNESITLYNDMAIVEFYWVFDATFSGEDPIPVQTKGRETQVLKKIDNTWRIVHIHYSGMPETRQREGS